MLGQQQQQAPFELVVLYQVWLMFLLNAAVMGGAPL